MSEDRDALKKEVWSLFQPMQVVWLATSDGDKPTVRPLAMVFVDGRFWIGTGAPSNKVKHLKSNPNVEFSMALSEGYQAPGNIRARGTAEIVEDPETKKKAAESMPYFSMFWKSPDDPGFTLLELKPTQIDYVRKGEWRVNTFDV